MIVNHLDIKATISDTVAVPEPTEIYISTKSKIAYLAQHPVDLRYILGYSCYLLLYSSKWC